MDPSIGQEQPNIPIYSFFVAIAQFSTYIIGILMLPYVSNDKYKEEKERLGYPKSIHEIRKAKEDLQN
jgi:hypothetical protein